MAELHVVVTGRVQGVGFRWFVRQEARRVGVAGWVRNLPDRSVEVAARGEQNSIAALERALREGPDGARVDDLRTLPVEGVGGLPFPFEIHR